MLRPHAPVAERVIVPGDPGRALRLAVALTGGVPKMLNHHRGLWGYTGTAADGALLTVQSTGLGGPSAAAVIADLAVLGARRLVRVGTCTGVDLPLGTLLVADPVVGLDGTSQALGAGLSPDGPSGAGGLPALAVASTDLPRHPVPPGTRAQDRTSAAVVAAARVAGLAVTVLLVVAEDASGARLDDEALHAAEIELGRAAF